MNKVNATIILLLKIITINNYIETWCKRHYNSAIFTVNHSDYTGKEGKLYYQLVNGDSFGQKSEVIDNCYSCYNCLLNLLKLLNYRYSISIICGKRRQHIRSKLNSSALLISIPVWCSYYSDIIMLQLLNVSSYR